MAEENTSQDYTFKNINETRKNFVEATEQNELMSKKHKKVCTTLNYIKHFLISLSEITGCISTSAFAFCFTCYSYRNYKLYIRI